MQSLGKGAKRVENMDRYETIRNATTEVCIRVTTTKEGSRITEYTVKGNPNTATGKAAWYWYILETVVREAGLVKERNRGIFGAILGGR